MTREEDLIRIAKKLDKMVSRNNTDGAIDLLKELKSFNMTLKLLQETRIGMSVNNIRKHCRDEEVIALAKVLIKEWKRLLDSGDSHCEKVDELKNGLDARKPAAATNSCSSEPQSSHRRLEAKPKHESDSDKNRNEKQNDNHINKKSHADDPGTDGKHLEGHQSEKHLQEIRAEKQTPAENPKPETDHKKQRHAPDLQSGKHKSEPIKHRSLEDLKKMRNAELLKKEKPPEEPKKYTDDGKQDKSRAEGRHEWPVGTPQRGKPAEAHKLIFERKDSDDGKASKKLSEDTKRERKDSSDSKPPSTKKPTIEVKKEKHRKDSSELKPSQPAKGHSTDSKSVRRESLGSKPLGQPQRKLSTDSLDRKGKTEAPRTPTTPTSPLSPSFSSPGGPLSPHLATGDSVRDKCIEMLTAALRTDNDYKDFGANCDGMAAEIEDHIYQEIRATDMKYKNRVRSRISNLKDPKNPGLRRNVLAGSIELSRIASMSAEEMASDELKQLRNVLTQEAIREHQMAKTGGTTTDLLQCGKCKKKNCTYNQVQTRSADEPMTTFVLCNECGNRWKFC
ncbi:transcription elongation factor A protein 3 isoform X3 [Xiphophorus couchianus]|uniref:transcription elongation factor A protein 3 isoform X3 n=1 Tax=Xiphophorus couchianus TaxID=32473 RepID=UPI001016AD91|nr:transcription elongation factor A protein 3-like isoform X3 [Xiphophorus couchianus]